MALTLAEQRTKLAQFLASDLDNFEGETPTDEALTAQLNEALRTISEEIYQLDPSILLTPTAELGTVDLRDVTTTNPAHTGSVSRKVIDPLVVVINGNPLWAYSRRKYGLWKLQEIQEFNPKWRTDSSGTPTKAAVMDRTLYLHPMPNAGVVSGASNYIMGQYLAADQVLGDDDNNYPDLPEELHTAIVRLAAIYAADPSVSESEGLARLQRFDARAAQAIARTKDRNRRQAQSWGTVSGQRIADYIIC